MVPTLARYQGTAERGSKTAKMRHRKVPSWLEVESQRGKVQATGVSNKL